MRKPLKPHNIPAKAKGLVAVVVRPGCVVGCPGDLQVDGVGVGEQAGVSRRTRAKEAGVVLEKSNSASTEPSASPVSPGMMTPARLEAIA